MRGPRWGVLPAEVYGKVWLDLFRRRGGRVYWIGSGDFIIAWRRSA